MSKRLRHSTPRWQRSGTSLAVNYRVPSPPATACRQSEVIVSREMTGISDAEFSAIWNAAIDWQYLVIQAGGIARKSDLDAWLQNRFNLTLAAAHSISNYVESKALYQIRSGNIAWLADAAGRPAPERSQYPDLDEDLDAAWVHKVNTLATACDDQLAYECPATERLLTHTPSKELAALTAAYVEIASGGTLELTSPSKTKPAHNPPAQLELF